MGPRNTGPQTPLNMGPRNTGPQTPPRGSRAVVALMPAQLQHEWDLYHATWFTLMGIGGGIFLLARLLRIERRLGVWLGLPLVDLVSFVVIGVGGLVLIWSLGRPFRMLRAVLKPGTSWISRGAIADFIFVAVGAVLVLPGLTLGGTMPFAWLPWDPWATTPIGKVLEVIGLLSAAVVIVYAGLVLADKAAITFWRSWLIPAQFVASSLATSIALITVMETLNRAPIDTIECWLLAKFSALLLLLIAWHLATDRAKPGKAEALERLQTCYRWLFFGGVIGAGTLLPALMGIVGVVAPSDRAAIGVASFVLTLGGGFFLRLITLRVGYFPPVSGALRLSKRR
jgi:formate-dependent nitrite reductase membrane component NrfD